MEIPRLLRYTFSSPESRRKMRERKKIIQGMVDTIINHNSHQEPSPATVNTSEQAVYRGTLLGWAVMSALTREQTFTSGTSNCYSQNAACFTDDPKLANLYPQLWSDHPELYLYTALRKMKRREGLRINRRGQKELERKLSPRVTIEAIIPKKDYAPFPSINSYLHTFQNVLRVRVADLSNISAAEIKNQIGVNPVDIAQWLANL